ncbi:MAG TPA: long-chain fatty acid--CoA ligase [Candidatus Krumholzibacteria bacterium]|nr:long-chain fatty acid--CoA ligase [Candidatus Krumholzibacteria bacterium]
MRNIALLIRERARTRPDRPALREKAGGAWREITYGELDRDVERLARGFLALGVDAGDRVALLSANMPEWSLTDLAVQSVRGVTVPLYATSTAEQVAGILQDAGAEIACAGGEADAANLAEVRESCGLPRRIVVFRGEAPDPARDLTLDQVRAAGDAVGPEETALRAAAAAADDLATIIYTSGTTGEPKGVMLAPDNFANQFAHLDRWFTIDERDRSLCFLPLSHVFERAWSYYVYLQGASNSFVLNPREVADYLREVRPTALVAVPRVYDKVYSMVHEKVESAPPLRRRLFRWAVRTGFRYQTRTRQQKLPAGPGLKLSHALADRLVLGKIRDAMGGPKSVMASGGAPLSAEVGEFLLSAGLLVCEGYGLTETSPMLTCNTPDAFRFGAVGRPIQDVELRISEEGEVLARGPNVTRGYFNNPEATAEAFQDGWFRTGDVGHLDQDGFLVITDRLKDLIVTSGGKNVAPQRVETIIGQDPYVEQLAVVGDSQKFLGALVVPSFDALKAWAGQHKLPFQDAEELIRLPEVVKFMNERIAERCRHLAPFERVRKIHLLPRPFSMDLGELTPTLKVRRKAVAAAYRDVIERMFA